MLLIQVENERKRIGEGMQQNCEFCVMLIPRERSVDEREDNKESSDAILSVDWLLTVDSCEFSAHQNLKHHTL